MPERTLSREQLRSMSIDDLKTAKAGVERELQKKHAESLNHACKAVGKIAKQYGIELDELIVVLKGDNALKKRKKSRVAKPSKRQTKVVKFAHPSDASKVWSGRGRQPSWIKEALVEGKQLSDFLIK